jgi:hypothetical protein
LVQHRMHEPGAVNRALPQASGRRRQWRTNAGDGNIGAGVGFGLFAAIVTETANETLSRVLLVIGIALGVLFAIYFWVRVVR